MIHPKYNPQEALERIKLNMKYDTSKTLNENKQQIEEQDMGMNTAIGTGIAAGTGAAYGGLAGAGALGGMGTSAAGASLAVGTALGKATIGAGAATALGASVIAGAAALAVIPLVIWLIDKDNAKVKVEKLFQYCKTDKTKIDKIERGLSIQEIRNLSVQLYDAMKGAGTDEEKVYSAFNTLKTASDFCALVDRFNADWGSEGGDLLEWLDSDFDQTSEWNKIYIPIRNVVEDTLLSIKDDQVEKECKENPNQEKCKAKIDDGKKKGGGGSYKPCKGGNYVYGCSDPVIAKVQGCLGGLTADGKFGPKTQSKLKEKFPNLSNGFKESDVNTICSGGSNEEVVSDEEKVSDVNSTNY